MIPCPCTGTRHTCAARDGQRRETRKGRKLPAEYRARDNARRVVVRTDHEGLRAELPRLSKASPSTQDAVAEFIKREIDGGKR